MKSDSAIRRPVLARHAQYRWDAIRKQHQLVFPEGVLVLNDSGAAIVKLCDGRLIDDLASELNTQFADCDPSADLLTFLDRLSEKGLLRDAVDS